MRVSRFFITESIDQGEEIRLEGSRAHYLRNVLRLKPGDPLIVFNGDGGEFRALISQIDRTATLLKIGEFDPINRQSALSIELGIAMVKKEAMDAAIQKSTELGAYKITPIISNNTSVSTRGLEKRLCHWQQISYSACEQCGLNIPPVFGSVETYPDWISRSTSDLRLIASPVSGATLTDITTIPKSIAIAIGPEGGFTTQEHNAAVSCGFTSINLGARILRTDTAVTALLTLVQSRWGDLDSSEKKADA